MGSDKTQGSTGVPLTTRGKERTHARERAFERYGVELTDVALADMRIQIRDGRAAVLEMRSKAFGVFLVHWADAQRTVPVFYNIARRQITSVLPPDWRKTARRAALRNALENY